MSLHHPPKPATRTSPAEAHAVWRRYKATGDTRLRDRLVMAYMPMVQYIVGKKVRELPARCELEDFVSCGVIGLIGAIDRFDEGKGATLEQYAWTRIQGAVIDELRRLDWAPRSLRRWERDSNRTRDGFQARHGRQPTAEEIAELLDVEVEEVTRRRQELALADVVSLNDLVSASDDAAIERVDTVADPDAWCDPEAAEARRQGKDRFRDAFAQLPERDREVAVMLYVKNMTLREIGDAFGVSESRVCQIHAQLKKKLRRDLGEDEELIRAV